MMAALRGRGYLRLAFRETRAGNEPFPPNQIFLTRLAAFVEFKDEFSGDIECDGQRDHHDREVAVRYRRILFSHSHSSSNEVIGLPEWTARTSTAAAGSVKSSPAQWGCGPGLPSRAFHRYSGPGLFFPRCS